MSDDKYVSPMPLALHPVGHLDDFFPAQKVREDVQIFSPVPDGSGVQNYKFNGRYHLADEGGD